MTLIEWPQARDKMREHWPRWIHASCRVFFDARSSPFDLFYEGLSSDDRFNDQGQKLQQYAEFRLDGPEINVKGRWLLIEINILCISHLVDKDGTLLDKMLGTFTKAMEDCIPVYKYGNENPFIDTRQRIGTLRMIDTIEPAIRVTRFGQPSADIRMLQATVEASYRMKEPT